MGNYFIKLKEHITISNCTKAMSVIYFGVSTLEFLLISTNQYENLDIIPVVYFGGVTISAIMGALDGLLSVNHYQSAMVTYVNQTFATLAGFMVGAVTGIFWPMMAVLRPFAK